MDMNRAVIDNPISKLFRKRVKVIGVLYCIFHPLAFVESDIYFACLSFGRYPTLFSDIHQQYKKKFIMYRWLF